MKEPLSTNKVDKMGSTLRFYPRWAVAVATDPEYPNPFDKDNNTSKAVAARVRFHPTGTLVVGASAYADRLEEYDKKGVDTGERTDLLSYGGHASWEGRPAGLELEYVRGYYETSDGSRVARDGLSVMGWANLGCVRPYVRYEAHDPDHAIADNEAHVVLGGLNLRLEHGLYLKAELDAFDAGVKNKRFKGQSYTEFKASISYGF